MNQYTKSMMAALLCAAASWANADIAVVVNPAYAASSASAEDLSKLFLSKADSVTGGGHLTPVDQPENAPARTVFYDKVCSKNPEQLNSYWSRLIFTGQGQPPKIIEGGDAAVVDYVSKTADAVGYVSATAVNAKVKVIATFPE
ncbi:MAG TPA: phosphate ABC transporter substrate-binding protein [Pseudomonadales bacterium]|nr:phosphate ABC transporter substrate-binding protein [Pseudomonadales bacterium]